VLFRLYRSKKECTAHDGDYQKKTELARQLINVFVTWTDRRIELAADSAYCNDTVTRGLCRRVVLFGAMRPDAVLTSLPCSTAVGARRGRPRKRGNPLPKPERVAQDERRPWQTTELLLYGRKTVVRYKTLTAQWYRACGTRLLRIVVVATFQGTVPWRVFYRGRQHQPPGRAPGATLVHPQARSELRGHPARRSTRSGQLRRSGSIPRYQQLASTSRSRRKRRARPRAARAQGRLKRRNPSLSCASHRRRQAS
jgi:hypothetical protein